jgi:hypothetical protein
MEQPGRSADREAPRKQRHTARRVWQRLVDEHGVEVSERQVRRHVRVRRRELGEPVEEVFVPHTWCRRWARSRSSTPCSRTAASPSSSGGSPAAARACAKRSERRRACSGRCRSRRSRRPSPPRRASTRRRWSRSGKTATRRLPGAALLVACGFRAHRRRAFEGRPSGASAGEGDPQRPCAQVESAELGHRPVAGTPLSVESPSPPMNRDVPAAHLMRSVFPRNEEALVRDRRLYVDRNRGGCAALPRPNVCRCRFPTGPARRAACRRLRASPT